MIQIAKEAYKQIVGLNYESCGFLLGRDGKFERVFQMRNHSKKFFRYKMSRFDVLKFVIHFFRSKENQFIIYHCHQFKEHLSYKDMTTMIPGIIYGICFNRKLFFYQKSIFGNISSIPHDYIMENNNGPAI